MKRPALVTVAAVLQSLLALVIVGTTVYLIWLAHSPQIQSEPDARDAAHGIMIGAMVLAGPAIILSIASWGLWICKRWSWWMSILINFVVFGTLLYSTLDDNSIDWEQVGLAVCFGALSGLLLLPRVRKFYCPAHSARSASPVLE